MHHRRIFLLSLAAATFAAGSPGAAIGQDTVPSADSAEVVAIAAEPAPSGLPILATLGVGYGRRSDPCSSCASPDNTNSFTGQVSLGKRLARGLGVGVRASVWRRGHPGPPAAADSTGVPTPTTLVNTLGNASVVFSWQVWHVWLEGGGGLAWAGEDLVDADSSALVHASGVGIGYTVGGGVALPLAGPLSLAFFGNYNAGGYDLTSPTAVVERGAKHRYLELGIGLTLR